MLPAIAAIFSASRTMGTKTTMAPSARCRIIDPPIKPESSGQRGSVFTSKRLKRSAIFARLTPCSLSRVRRAYLAMRCEIQYEYTLALHVRLSQRAKGRGQRAEGKEQRQSQRAKSRGQRGKGRAATQTLRAEGNSGLT